MFLEPSVDVSVTVVCLGRSAVMKTGLFLKMVLTYNYTRFGQRLSNGTTSDGEEYADRNS